MNNYRDRSHFMNARQLPQLSTVVDDMPTYAESVIVGGFIFIYVPIAITVRSQ